MLRASRNPLDRMRASRLLPALLLLLALASSVPGFHAVSHIVEAADHGALAAPHVARRLRRWFSRLPSGVPGMPLGWRLVLRACTGRAVRAPQRDEYLVRGRSTSRNRPPRRSRCPLAAKTEARPADALSLIERRALASSALCRFIHARDAMFMRITLVAAAAATHLSSFAQADSTAEIRLQLQQLREQYEARIKALEQRLDAAEKAQAAAAAAPPAPAAPAPMPAPSPTPQAAPGLALSAVLTGTYANLRNDPETYRIQGFIPGGDELGPGSRSFSLGESELTLSANVDPYFAGRLTFALTPENEAEVEEAYFRTTALPHGFTI